jgi:hypothetical protein
MEDTMLGKRIVVGGLLVALLLVPSLAFADADFGVSVSTTIRCNSVDFTVNIAEGAAPYALYFEFGDGETYSALDTGGSMIIPHIYPAQGTFEWKLTVEDKNGGLGEAEGEVVIPGPEVSLTSVPFPPVLVLIDGQASAGFTANVDGTAPQYTYTWQIENENGVDESFTGSEASGTYTSAGTYSARVTVSDSCQLAGSAELAVVVIDPNEDPEKACHPTALKIAQAVSGLFPLQAEQTYTCEDILQIFNYGTDAYEGHVGFGRLWHAYQLAQVIEELTWEQIRDWKLDGYGWGSLLQLDRFAEALQDIDVLNLMERVLSGENSVKDIRTAVRAATLHEADFEDALSRIGDGATPGDLNQFYRLIGDLDVEPAALDNWLEEGLSITDLRHISKLAERTDTSWEELASVRVLDYSWGEIGQAYRLADDELSAEEILALGIKTVREMDRDRTREERRQRNAERLAEQFEGEDAADLMALYNGECANDWSCVRKHLRDQERTQTQTESYNEQELRKAQQIASKYGVSVEQVLAQYESCSGNWGCVQAQFRAETGKTKDK